MAVFFDRPATVFDEAPFEKSADSLDRVEDLQRALLTENYILPAAFSNYEAYAVLNKNGPFIPSPSRRERDGNVTHYYVREETRTLDGGDGDDYLFGQGGNDSLQGSLGNDYLQGDDGALAGEYHGDDTLDGSSGNDTLLGDGGNDTISIVNVNPDDVYAQRAIDRILADDRDFDATANTALQNRNRAETHFFSAATANYRPPACKQLDTACCL